MLKKVLSIILAVALLASVCPAALAQQLETEGSSWVQTFTDLAENTVPEGMRLEGLPALYEGAETLPEEQKNIAFTQGVGGLFGKEAGDTAFLARTQYDGDTLPTIPPDTGAYAGIKLKNDAGDDGKSAILPGITALVEDDVLHISFEYAVNNYAADRQVKLWARPSNKKVQETGSTFLKIGKDTGAVSVFGSAANGFVMPLNQWVRFDFVFREPKRTGGSYVDVYINGELAIEDLVFDAKSGKPMDVIEPLMGFGYLEFIEPMGLVDGVYPQTDTYVDNISIAFGKEVPQINGVTLSHSDAQIDANINNATNSIILPNSITAEAFLSGLSVEGGSAYLVTLGGAEQTGSSSIESGYVRVDTGDGRYIYYNLSVYEQSNYLEENFNGKTITSKEELAEQTALTLAGADGVTVQSRTAMGGRSSGDSSLAVTAGTEETDTVLSWTADAAIAEETIVLEQSVLVNSGAALELRAGFSGAEPAKTVIALFDAAGKILVNGQDTGKTWQPNRFYRVAAVISRAAGTWSVYVNGEACVENAEISVDGITGLDGMEAVLLGSGTTAAFDDFKVHTGEYVPSADDISVTARTDDCIVSEGEKTIYILPGTDKDALLDLLTLDNCELDAIYTDTSLTQTTTDSTLTDGNVLLLVNAIGTVFEGYTVSIMEDVLGIESMSKYTFDNEAKTVIAPVGMPISEFYEMITLYSGHTGQVVDAAGEPVSADSKITLGSDWEYRITYKSLTADYEMVTAYVNETFDDLAGEKIYESGTDYNGMRLDISKIGGSAENVYVEGVTDNGENVAKFYSNATNPDGQAKITLRCDNIAPEKTKAPFILTWDMKMDDLNGLNSIVLRYTHKNGETDKYHNLLDVQGGTIELAGSAVATYETGEWVRFAIAISPSGGMSRAYVNGKLVYDRGLSVFQKLADHIDDIIFTHGVTNGERTTLMDNIAFYPAYDINSYDVSQMDSSASTEYDIVGEDNEITGYGPATVEEFLGLFTFPEGATYGVVDASGAPATGESTVEPGMTLAVTSADGQYTTKYPIGERMRIKTALNIAGREMGYLIEGEATATAEAYSALPQEMELSLSYTNTADPSKNKTVTDRKTVSGAATFETGVAAQVLNQEGETLTMRLTDPARDEDLAEPVILTYTGQLDLGSEIMEAKNGATSIVTLTMDDGVQGYVEKFNSLYQTYGLRGTAMVWSNRLAENLAFYSRIFEQGYIDLGSHSKTHVTLTSSVTDEVREAEIKGSQSEMKAMFPGQEVITYAPADNKLDDRSLELAKETYWAIRRGKRGFNSLNPPEDGIGGWYDLKIQGVYNPIDMNEQDCTLDHLLDIAAEEPVWMIEMFHGLDGGFGAVSTAVATQHFKKMSEMQNEGKIWVASFPEATKYIRERQNTVISDVATEDTRTVTLTMTNLPEDIFNAPLTVKSEVPADWASGYVKVTQGSSVQAPDIVLEEGRYYIYYDAVPNKGGITIESVAEKPMITITGLKIVSEGEMEQQADAVTPVLFTAQTTPTGSVDDTGIGWYVNGERQTAYDGKLEFSFTPRDVGTYVIYAMDSKTGIKSLESVVTVKEPGLQFEDDFNGYGEAATVPSDNWYTNATVGLEAVSDDSADKAAVFGLSLNEAKYPALHKTANAQTGTPLVYRAKVKLVNDGSNKQKFYLEIRNSEEGNVQANRMTVFQINHDTITSASGAEIGKISMGEWLAFSVCIVPGNEVKGEEPGADTTLSKIRISLSSPALTDMQGGNVGADIFFEEEVSLANIAISEYGTCNMLFNNDFSKANEAAKTYLDDVMIYNPQSLRMSAPAEPVNPGESVTIKVNKDLYGFDASKVTVTKDGGVPAVIKTASYSLFNPGEIVLEFDYGALEKSSTYTVTLSGLMDAAGDDVSGSATFTTSDKDVPINSSIMEDVACYFDGETVILETESERNILAYIAVYETVDGAQRVKDVTEYRVTCAAGQEAQFTLTKPEVLPGEEAVLLIWESGTLKPVIKAVTLEQ